MPICKSDVAPMASTYSAAVSFPTKSKSVEEVRKLNFLGQSSQGRFPWTEAYSSPAKKVSCSMQGCPSSDKSHHDFMSCPSCCGATVPTPRPDTVQQKTSWEVLSLWVDLPDEDLFPSGGLLTRIFPDRRLGKPRHETYDFEMDSGDAEEMVRNILNDSTEK